MPARGHGMDQKGNKRLKNKEGEARSVRGPAKTTGDVSLVRRVVVITLSRCGTFIEERDDRYNYSTPTLSRLFPLGFHNQSNFKLAIT